MSKTGPGTCVLIASLLLVSLPLLPPDWSRLFAPREAATQVGRQVVEGREREGSCALVQVLHTIDFLFKAKLAVILGR